VGGGVLVLGKYYCLGVVRTPRPPRFLQGEVEGLFFIGVRGKFGWFGVVFLVLDEGLWLGEDRGIEIPLPCLWDGLKYG